MISSHLQTSVSKVLRPRHLSATLLVTFAASTLGCALQENETDTTLIPSPMLIHFDQNRHGDIPDYLSYEDCGPRDANALDNRPAWRVIRDIFAPSPMFALVQSSNRANTSCYPITLIRNKTQQDVKLSVFIRFVEGKGKRQAGLTWRYKDPHNYYAALVDDINQRATVIIMKKGRPSELAVSRIPGKILPERDPRKLLKWHELQVLADGDTFTVWLDRVEIMSGKDKTLINPGRVGMLTRSDTRAVFDNFIVQ